jgi:hypothetical protein
MPAILTSETRLLIEVASDIDPIQTTDEVTLASGTSYEITPSGCARIRAAQGLAAPTWVTANPTTTTPRVHPWDVAHDFAAQPPTVTTVPVQFVEPDLLQEFVYQTPTEPSALFELGGSRACE